MIINLSREEVKAAVTALENFQAYADDCTRNDLKFVQSAKRQLMNALFIQSVREVRDETD